MGKKNSGIKWLYKNFKGLTLILMLFCGALVLISEPFYKNKKEISRLASLISNGQATTAALNDQYTERTLKIAGLPVKSYITEYSFKHNNRAYTGSITTDAVPSNRTIKVFFDPADPSNNNPNPQKALDTLTDKSNDWTFFSIGLALLLLSLFLLYRRFVSLKTHLGSTRSKKKVSAVKPNEKIKWASKKVAKDNAEPKASFKKKTPVDVNEPLSRSYLESLKDDKIKEFSKSDHASFMPPGLRAAFEEE